MCNFLENIQFWSEDAESWCYLEDSHFVCVVFCVFVWFIHDFLLSWICPTAQLAVTASCSVCLHYIEELFSIWFSPCNQIFYLKLLHPEQNLSTEVENYWHICQHSHERTEDIMHTGVQIIKSVEHVEFCTEVSADVLLLESLKQHYHAENCWYWNEVLYFQVQAAL